VQHLERHDPVHAQLAGAIDLAHPALADQLEDLVTSQLLMGG